MIILQLAAVLLLAAANPTPSETTKEKPAAAAPEGKAPQEKVICTREVLVGSNMPKKVCRTKTQVEASRDAAQRVLDSRQQLNGAEDPAK